MLPINFTFHDPGQAWFWADRWQELERQAQIYIDAGRVTTFHTVDEALARLEKTKSNWNETIELCLRSNSSCSKGRKLLEIKEHYQIHG